jgi:hypothetical protein
MKKIVVLILVGLSFIGCELRSGEKLIPGSNGRFNELQIVMNPTDWEGKIGKELKKIVLQEVIALPQPEPIFAVTQIPTQGFKGFLKHNRSILIIKQADKPTINTAYDVYAKPQVIVEVKGPNKQSIIDLIKNNSTVLVSTFKDHDYMIAQERIEKRSHLASSVHFYKTQNLKINVPGEYSKVDDKDDFVWFRKRFEDYGYNVHGSLNIVAYTIPLTDSFAKLKDSIISIRDSLGKKFIQGSSEDSYLVTEAAYTPHIFDSKLDGKEAYKVFGKWEMLYVFEAGPFVGYYVHDQKNNRLVIVEGIVYAPGIKKRDFMFEVEAIVRSLQIL